MASTYNFSGARCAERVHGKAWGPGSTREQRCRDSGELGPGRSGTREAGRQDSRMNLGAG